MQIRSFAAAVAAALSVLTIVSAATAAGAKQPGDDGNGQAASDPPAAVNYDTSLPLRDMAPAPGPAAGTKKEHPQHKYPVASSTSAADPVVQSTVGDAAAPLLSTNFDGVGQGFSGPSGTFGVTSAPPDPNGAVGPLNYVEVVNTSFAVFNKSGVPLY